MTTRQAANSDLIGLSDGRTRLLKPALVLDLLRFVSAPPARFDPGQGKPRRTSIKFGRQKINLRPVDADPVVWFTGVNATAGSDDLFFSPKRHRTTWRRICARIMSRSRKGR